MLQLIRKWKERRVHRKEMALFCEQVTKFRLVEVRRFDDGQEGKVAHDVKSTK
jgi:hypothetical protein